MNHGGTCVACFHSPHGLDRRADPFSKIFLCQVSAPTCKRNCLTESGQAARNWQWRRGQKFHLKHILWRIKIFSKSYMSDYLRKIQKFTFAEIRKIAHSGAVWGPPSARPAVIRSLGKTNPRNRQGARRLPEHQNNRDLTPINALTLRFVN
jgi:hypothetical protein